MTTSCPGVVISIFLFGGWSFAEAADDLPADKPPISWTAVAENLAGADLSFTVGDDRTERMSVFGFQSTGSDVPGSYAFGRNQRITIPLADNVVSHGSRSRQVGRLSVWDDTAWRVVRDIPVAVEPNRIETGEAIGREGLFRLTVVLPTHDGRSTKVDGHIIVSSSWRRDLLSHCRRRREYVELNPDPNLVQSSLATSHWDHVMELAADAPILSARLLAALKEAARSHAAYRDGVCPDLLIGLNKIKLRRFPGARIEDFAVCVPDAYTESEAWPVFVHTDNQRWEVAAGYPQRSGMIDVWWHTITDKDVDWKSYGALMDVLALKLNLDWDRIYLCGECANGLAAMSLALNHADHWAECSVSLTSTYRQLAMNARNLDMIFVKGRHNEANAAAYYDFALKCFRHHGCDRVRDSLTKSITEVRGTPLPTSVRTKRPNRVSYAVESLHYPSAYWAEIVGRDDENLIGSIEACVKGQTVHVKTCNVDAYDLNLAAAPLDPNRPVEVIENGQSLGDITSSVFRRRCAKYVDVARIKTPSVCGPVSDVFSSPYVVVWGAGGTDRELSAASEEVALALADGAPLFSDAEFPERSFGDHNIVVVGTSPSNRYLDAVNDGLPVRVEVGGISAGKCRYAGPDMGTIFIYPNPRNLRRYVAVFSGTSERAMASMLEAYSKMKTARPADVAIFEVRTEGGLRWHMMERFDTVWDWHDDWDRCVVAFDQTPPKWQWCQWAAKIVREQLNADVAICESPLLADSVAPSARLTYRDLFNIFSNTWYTKASISGKNLRAIVTQPLSGASSRDVEALTVEGIVLSRRPADDRSTALTIGELLDDTHYTVVLPEKCLNGGRLGFILQEYEILDQGHFMSFLKAHLAGATAAHIKSEFKTMRYGTF